MDIHKKIEEIRQKPDHEKIRYVWGAVTISMLFVFIIWIFSIRVSFQKNQTTETNQATEELEAKLKNLKEAAPSLKNLTGEGLLKANLDLPQKSE